MSTSYRYQLFSIFKHKSNGTDVAPSWERWELWDRRKMKRLAYKIMSITGFLPRVSGAPAFFRGHHRSRTSHTSPSMSGEGFHHMQGKA